MHRNAIISTNNLETLGRVRAHPRAVTEAQWRYFDMSILSKKKTCRKCGEEKPLSEFYKDKKAPDGLFYVCKQCELARSSSWWKEHRDDEGRPRRLEVKKKYYQSNKVRLDEANKQWAKNNPDKRRAILQRSYQKSPEKYKERSSKWRAENPDKILSISRNRDARERSGVGRISAREWRELKEKYNYTCLCCWRREPEIKLTLDHVKPLAIGGENVVSNAQPLCGSCNSSKGTKWIDYRW
jgi:5-methylcytosine-specific restriction endonuclease McrA